MTEGKRYSFNEKQNQISGCNKPGDVIFEI